MTRSLRSAVLLTVALLGCRTAPAPVPAPTLAPATRVVTLAREFGLAGIFTRITIHERATGVTGVVVVTSGEGNRRSMERAYGCRMRWDASEDAEHFSCTAPFPQGTPDWGAMLARLDSLGIDSPPSPREHPNLICSDGSPWGLGVEYPTDPGRPAVTTRSACGPQHGARRAFEDGVQAVITAIDGAAHAH